MKLREFDKETVTLELTAAEFRDLVSAIFVVDQEFEQLDHVIFDVPLERVEALRDALYDVSVARSDRFRREQEQAASS